MKTRLLTILAGFWAILSFSQAYNLVIFSEDGSKFTLFLNNVQQHENPENNVWIGGLNSPAYKAKIVFDDASKPTLEKTIYFPEENTEVTYQIVEKKGVYKLRGFSSVLIPTTYTETPNQRAVTLITEPVYTETVTTRTVVQENNDSMNMDVNMGGMGVSVNVNVNNGMGNEVIYEETTTTVATGDHYILKGYGGPIGCPWPMEEADFQEAKRTISSKDWDETRLSLAKQIVSANCLFADQVRDLMQLMEWEETKLEFAKFAYGYTYDTGNYFKVSQAFEWESSTEELNRYISGH